MRRSLPALALLAASTAWGADDFPAWAREAAERTVPSYPIQVRAVALLHEEALTVDADGRRTMRERGVLKVLQRGASITAYRTYNTKAGRIRDFQAWSLMPRGKPASIPKNRILDVAVSPNQIYEEARAKALDFPDAVPGAIFAYEITEEEKTVFTQYAIPLQERMPRLVSRFSLTLPAGWEVTSTVFNSKGAQPSVSSNTHTWELRDLPYLEDEDFSPPLSSLAAWIAVSYFPPDGNSAGLRGLKDWSGVSQWLSTLVDPPAAVTEKIRAKSAELTAGANGEIEKIRAIARFVQQTNYVSVDLNITRGGGYTPHKADDVLTRNYGDCKDKATLMRALLNAAGIESFTTVISADDPHYVRPEWASPMQFNHAIVAIRVPDSVKASAVLENSPMGRLLMFDPTDPVTLLGDMPEDEQGSYALVIAGARGDLLKMPKSPAESSRIESLISASIDVSGKLDAKLARRYFGQSGVALQGMQRFAGEPELKQRFERGFSRRIPGAVLASLRSDQARSQDHVAVDFGLTADRFAQISAGRLFVIRPGLLTSGGEYFFEKTDRKGPIQLEADVRRDSIRIQIPAGFQLDELPRPAKIESPYGMLESKWTVANGEILMDSVLEIRDTIAPAEEYDQIREFFDRISGAHYAPVVLVRQ